MDIIISESQYQRLFESINEGMAVWDNFNQLQDLAKQIDDVNKKIGNNRPKGISKDFKYLEPEVGMIVVRVYFVNSIPKKQKHDGLSYSNQILIELWITPYYDLEDIEVILTHELTHQNNKIYGKQNIGHYFSNEKGFNWNSGTAAQKKLVDTVNDILYNLWSKDEQSAYQSVSVRNNFGNVQRRYEYLKELIDSLKKNVPYENLLYDIVSKHLEKGKQARNNHVKIKSNNSNSLNHNRMPSLANFKEWFIRESEKRLNNYYAKLKKNWYKYHTEVNPDEQAINVLRANQSLKAFTNNRLVKIKQYLIENLDYFTNELFSSIVKQQALTKSNWELVGVPFRLNIDSTENGYPAKLSLLLSRESKWGQEVRGDFVMTKLKLFYKMKNETPTVENNMTKDGYWRINIWPTAALEKHMRTLKYGDDYSQDKKLYAILKKLLQTEFTKLELEKR